MPAQKRSQVKAKGLRPQGLTDKEADLVKLVMSGKTQADAYREVYNVRPTTKDESIHQSACKILAKDRCRTFRRRIQEKLDMRGLLSLNQRLEILGALARDPEVAPGDKARVIKVYSDISGDRAPDRQELTGPDGRPLQLEHSISPLVRAVSPQARLAEMKARRAQAAAGVIPFLQPAADQTQTPPAPHTTDPHGEQPPAAEAQ